MELGKGMCYKRLAEKRVDYLFNEEHKKNKHGKMYETKGL